MARLLHIGVAMTHGLAYYRGILRGIRQFAETRPRWVFTTVTADTTALRILTHFKLDGLIAAAESRQLVKPILALRRPVVNIAAVVPDPLPFPRVGVDNAAVGRLAADHFLDLGLRHFGFVGSRGFLYSTARESAFRDALRQAGGSIYCFHDNLEHTFDPRGPQWPLDPRVHRWLRSLPKPIGIFTPNDVFGVRVTEACRKAKVRVPEDVAVLGVDNDDLYCELARPPLSSVIVPAARIGYEAAALLGRLMAGRKPPGQPILLPPPGVVTRRSTEVLAIDDPTVTAAVRFIRERAHLPLQVADVVDEVRVGRRWLERRFRKLLGKSVRQEIRRVQIERAKRLLIETDQPVKAIAVQAGFADLRRLAVVFRHELGTSPTAFRRQMRRGGIATG